MKRDLQAVADGVVMPKQPAMRLVETRRSCAIAETTPRYDVLLNGKLIERLWFNMRG